MKQCCMKREDTGKRCTSMVLDKDEACEECCELLGDLIEKLVREKELKSEDSHA